jgi:muconolactone D-isomerase
MLYLLDVEIDYSRLGEKRDQILQAEWKLTQELYERGILLGAWRKANARGVTEIWNCASHEEVNNLIRSIPLYPYLTRVEILPLLAHPGFPQFAESQFKELEKE